MNEVLDTIERELMIAVRRSNGRRRRRRSLGMFAAVVLSVGATAGLGVAAVLDTPIERLFSGSTRLAKPDRAPRVDMRLVDAGGLGWTVTTYVPKFGGIAMTTAADGLEVETPATVARNGFTIADGLLRGPLAGAELDVVRSGGRYHYLYAGTVDASATRVVVRIAGERLPATLTSQTISAPVEAPDPDTLTPHGKKVAARVPDEVSVRTFGVTLTPNALVRRRYVRATIVTTLEDGTTHRQRLAPQCVNTSCGLRAPKAAGPGRAG
ncbi:hypothetical protein [Conexibacter woesei]|uniref:Uncharacterized protein n=1 Tax=Conexibacter woesei (strain DSM 14684 / CCUG 47730 / CIP 108061 / JCM 11494 / NBRC 100937 / ID131577) TaxID=469383 RepID=D3FEP3_CONWI|nr:hypothetical protein [Conexibacter woesei]ADB49717.1 hypothetical protein Cwoe_1288 [Conexibacter woesei DSM 14684]